MKKRDHRHIAINMHVFFTLFLFLAFAGLSISSLASNDVGLAIGFAVATLFPLFVFLVSPLYFVFSDDGVEIIYHFGQREIIKWNAVKSVSLRGSWMGGGGPPRYEFAYPTSEKRIFFVRGEIPKTRKIQKLVRMYYKKDIT